MKINAAGLSLIKRWEGCVLTAYRCPANVLTIGIGHTGDVKAGDKITMHQAEVILEHDLERFEEYVSSIGVPLNENQFSALVSFAFNLGTAALANSTLLKLLRKGDLQGAADQFPRWALAAGKKLPGLVKRRADERELFLKPATTVPVG